MRLVAVTKKRPSEWVRALRDLGVEDFGENYPQELWSKAKDLPDLRARWHLIGHLQTNKARRIVPLVQVLHSVDSLRLLRVLEDLADGPAPPPTIFLQVNTSAEEAKHGWAPRSLLDQADEIVACRRLSILGLMTMAALGTTAEEARPSFETLREVRDAFRDRTGLALKELSMGMSNDYAVAIEEGATVVRVGSALFEGVES